MTAWALFSPRAKLYSLVPLSSQWPSTVTVTFPCCLSHATWSWRSSKASESKSELSYPKNTLSPTLTIKSSCEPETIPLPAVSEIVPSTVLLSEAVEPEPEVSAESFGFVAHAETNIISIVVIKNFYNIKNCSPNT